MKLDRLTTLMTSTCNNFLSQIKQLNNILILSAHILFASYSSTILAESVSSIEFNGVNPRSTPSGLKNSSHINNPLNSSLFNRTLSYGQVEFNLLTLTAKPLRNINTPRHKAKQDADSFLIESWKHQFLPLLNGLPIQIDGKSLTIAINETETQFFIATNKERALFSNTGKLVWKHDESELATDILITLNQKYIIIRYSDNIIRWYDYQNGETLFSLFINPETLQWIIWSPEGYYDSSEPNFASLTIENTNANDTSLSQLRFYLFRPAIIQKIINSESIDSMKVTKLPTNLTPPTVSLLNETEQLINFCITSPSNSTSRVIFSISDVSVQRKITSISNNDQQCPQVATFNKIASHAGYFLTVLAFDLDSKIWSKKLKHEIPPTSLVSKNKNNEAISKVIYINNESDKRISTKNSQLISNYFNKAIFQHLNLSSNNKIKTNLATEKYSGPFVLYLSSSCHVTANDIQFSLNKNSTPKMTLSRLKSNLQVTNNNYGLVFIDCLISENEFNRHHAKQHTHNFMFETGRTTIVQFSSNKESFMMETLARASNGEADENDDLSIDSHELMKFMTTILPETTFEGSGDSGIIFSQETVGNTFVLPIVIEQ